MSCLVATRVLVITLLSVGCYSTIVHACIRETWEILRNTKAFYSVYFETIFTPLSYGVILFLFCLIRAIPKLDHYQIDSQSHLKPTSNQFMYQALFHVIPLLFLDTFTIKQYPNTTLSQEGNYFLFFLWGNEIQTTRILPQEAPSMWEIILHIILATVIFDILFSITHFILHRIPVLYESIHKIHHGHIKGVTPDYTAELHALENLSLVLQANFALKVIGAHPMTRMIYIPILMFMIIDNHSGYDFPLNYDKVIPFRIISGSRNHFVHHNSGNQHYQPFFDYLNPIYRKIQLYL